MYCWHVHQIHACIHMHHTCMCVHAYTCIWVWFAFCVDVFTGLHMCRLDAFCLFWIACACITYRYKESRNCVFSVAVSCGPAPKAPTNGQQNISSTTFGSTVTYTCNRGYTLQGNSIRTCMANGRWSGRPPTCSGTLVLYICNQMMLHLHTMGIYLNYIAKHGGKNVF